MANEQSNLRLASDFRTVITRLIKKLRTKSATSLSLSLTERSTMALLDQHKELLPSELAGMEKITTQSMSQILSHLQEIGYINRKESATDKRKAIISLSKTGQTILHKLRDERDQWLNKALQATCSEKEQEQLRKCLPLLTRLVDFD
ncbi:MAG TPA: MarR family winged helix-turn-helix transcriptional regulator [Ferruginibacter sp.]|nr:MarR family winged helix-turn-helix transcriptional regulator [Ferruginibacter sp.]